jgi:hypothetical protein
MHEVHDFLSRSHPVEVLKRHSQLRFEHRASPSSYEDSHQNWPRHHSASSGTPQEALVLPPQADALVGANEASLLPTDEPTDEATGVDELESRYALQLAESRRFSAPSVSHHAEPRAHARSTSHSSHNKVPCPQKPSPSISRPTTTISGSHSFGGHSSAPILAFRQKPHMSVSSGSYIRWQFIQDNDELFPNDHNVVQANAESADDSIEIVVHLNHSDPQWMEVHPRQSDNLVAFDAPQCMRAVSAAFLRVYKARTIFKVEAATLAIRLCLSTSESGHPCYRGHLPLAAFYGTEWWDKARSRCVFMLCIESSTGRRFFGPVMSSEFHSATAFLFPFTVLASFSLLPSIPSLQATTSSTKSELYTDSSLFIGYLDLSVVSLIALCISQTFRSLLGSKGSRSRK